MKKFLHFIGLALIVLVLSSAMRVEAGYADPNTGGMLFQALAGIFVFLSGLILMFSSRIKLIFSFLRRHRDDSHGRMIQDQPETLEIYS